MTKLVTVFGGSGFLGRYVVPALLKQGSRVRVAARTASGSWHLQTQGGLGQTQFVAADIRRGASVAHALDGADAVVNLVGILDGDFEAVQLDGARIVAEAAARQGVGALVHVSAIGADPASASRYGQSKGAGEVAVLSAFPGATVLRPSIVFGREDQFINRFAALICALPIVPIIRGETRFQPVYVGDVAAAVAQAVADPLRHGGKTYELGGPQRMTMARINHWIAENTGRAPRFAAMPDWMAAAMAKGLGWMPGAPMTQDQWLMLQSDNVVTGVDGLAAMGIEPTPLDAVADDWLVRYRRNGRFAAEPAGKGL